MSGNGTDAIEISGPLQQAQDPVIVCLEHALAAAKAGRVNTIGIIMIDANGGVLPSWGGLRLGDLHLGCALTQYRLMQVFTTPQNQSRIWRPPPGMAG
jgi:hypothetical protein